MTVFLTKTWGFSEPCGPLQFSTTGWRDRARSLLQPGDKVAIVGTQGLPTDPEEQGRILGLMEPSTQVVMALDFPLGERAADFDEEGNYKWPYALLNKAAWKIADPPLLSTISTRKFEMDAVLGIVALTPGEAEALESIPRREIPLLQPKRAHARIEGYDAARKKSSPVPTTTRTGIMHMRDASAYTYIMELKHADTVSFKIGWAFDFKLRERQFNQASMPAIGGIRYKTIWFELCDTARRAYQLEQSLLRRFDKDRHPQNHEIIVGRTKREIEDAWMTETMRIRRLPISSKHPLPS